MPTLSLFPSSQVRPPALQASSPLQDLMVILLGRLCSRWKSSLPPQRRAQKPYKLTQRTSFSIDRKCPRQPLACVLETYLTAAPCLEPDQPKSCLECQITGQGKSSTNLSLIMFNSDRLERHLV